MVEEREGGAGPHPTNKKGEIIMLRVHKKHFTKAGYMVNCYDKAPTLPHPAR